MLLLTTRHRPATDLGFLLHKNPGRTHVQDLNFGRVHVVYPEATEEQTTVAVLLDIDPVGLVRGSGTLEQYVNDRPYVASSYLSVALIEAFKTAMNGRSKDRPELVDQPLPLEIRIPVLPSRRGGEEAIRRLFEPLGYTVDVHQEPLDAQFPEWGLSPYFDVTLRGEVTVQHALRHLYVLLPVLDSKKHYYMDGHEVQKLMDKGEGWLATHPHRNSIVHGYLGRKPSLVGAALSQLALLDEVAPDEERDDDEAEAPKERRVSLHEQRHDRVVEIIREWKPKSVVDVGCGEGRLIRKLIQVQGIDRIVGMDVAYYEVEKAIRRLHLEDAGPKMRERVQIIHGSLLYRDERLHGFEVCTVVEVIEHLDAPRLRTFEQVIFGDAAPKRLLITSPNKEYNAVYGEIAMRHDDHRFEWTRAEFEAWGVRVAEEFGYTVRFEGLGEAHPEFGSPSQLGVFEK